MKLAADNAELIERSRSIMERQLGQMVRLIDDLMDLTRISQGKLVLQKTRMPIAAAVRDAVDASRPLIVQQGHELVISMPDADLHVDGDGTRLAQVFANLLNNAAKYTDKGGLIRLTVEGRGRDVIVSVVDTGVGIPPHMLPKVFDMFTQVDRSLERAQGGLGLGLCIVKRLVELHGGRVEAASEGHGRGSRFVVCLPLAQVDAGLSAESGNGRAVDGIRRRILVVDDNRDGAVTLAEMLGVMGNEARTAHDGLEAVAVAEAFRPDVILMDIGMPGLNGYDACRRIRQETWGKRIVVVAQTGWGQEEDRRRSEDAGFDFHIVKPIDPAKLAQVLAGVQSPAG